MKITLINSASEMMQQIPEEFSIVQITYNYLKILSKDLMLEHIGFLVNNEDWFIEREFSKKWGIKSGPWTDIVISNEVFK